MSGILLYSRKSPYPVYLIKQVDSFVIDKKTGVVSMPLPEDEGDTTIVMKMMGSELGMSLDWTVAESPSGENIGMGTGKNTVFDQVEYLAFETATDECHFVSGEFGKSIKICAHYKGTGSELVHTNYYWVKDAQVEHGTFAFEGGLITCKATLKIVIGLVG